MVLKDLDTVIRETGWWWPNSEVFGMRSTVFAEGGEEIVHIEMTQSMPAVMRVRESTKVAAEIWPMCMPSTRPTSWKEKTWC